MLGTYLTIMLMSQIYLRAKSCNRVTTAAPRQSSSVVYCSGCKDDFRDEGREFLHTGPEAAKACEPNLTVLVHGKFRSPWVAARM